MTQKWFLFHIPFIFEFIAPSPIKIDTKKITKNSKQMWLWSVYGVSSNKLMTTLSGVPRHRTESFGSFWLYVPSRIKVQTLHSQEKSLHILSCKHIKLVSVQSNNSILLRLYASNSSSTVPVLILIRELFSIMCITLVFSLKSSMPSVRMNCRIRTNLSVVAICGVIYSFVTRALTGACVSIVVGGPIVATFPLAGFFQKFSTSR